jgi:hypothetical protein
MKLKLILALSFATNLVLSGAAVYFWQTRTEFQGRDKALPVIVATTPVAPPPAKRFSWNEVQSDHLMVYMDNLRSIGCPEDVILRIVRTDEPQQTTAGERNQASPQGAAYLSGSSTNGGASAGQSQSTAQTTGTGYLAPVGYGGGATTGQNGRVGSGVATMSGSGVASSPRRAVTPLAWQDGSVSSTTVSPVVAGGSSGVASAGGGTSVALTEAQAAGVNSVQDAFVDEMSGSSRNANDPAYARQWAGAQQRADDRMRAMLGDAAFMQYQLNAARQGK